MLLERSEWNKSHYSPKPEVEVNDDLFSTKVQPELKTCFYFALMSYVTILVTKQKWFAHDPLISSLEVSLPLRGMLACHYSYNCFVMWRPRDTISAQTMACHQSRVWGGVIVGYVPKNVKIISFCRITSPFCYYFHSKLWSSATKNSKYHVLLNRCNPITR